MPRILPIDVGAVIDGFLFDLAFIIITKKGYHKITGCSAK
jgi:hypothetical protein